MAFFLSTLERRNHHQSALLAPWTALASTGSQKVPVATLRSRQQLGVTLACMSCSQLESNLHILDEMSFSSSPTVHY